VKLFSSFSFLSSFGAKKAEQAGDGIVALIVKFDPETASEAQIEEFRKELDILTGRVAGLRTDYSREKSEAEAVRARYNELVAAAELLQKRSEAAEGDAKTSLEASVGKIVAELEGLLPDLKREEAEAVEAGEFLREFEQAAEEAARKLTTARTQLDAARQNMARAELRRERAEDKAEQTEVLVGIRKKSDSMGVALAAMQSEANKDEQAASAAKLKVELLTKSAPRKLDEDPNIKAAIAEASGTTQPTGLTGRLAALKSKAAVAA
jgi:chromosome segregation ATPase